MSDLRAALLGFLHAADAEQQRRYLHVHPELTSPAGLATVDSLIMDSDPVLVDALLARRSLLERCWRLGVDEAFEAAPSGHRDHETPLTSRDRIAGILGVDPSAIDITPTGPGTGYFAPAAGVTADHRPDCPGRRGDRPTRGARRRCGHGRPAPRGRPAGAGPRPS